MPALIQLDAIPQSTMEEADEEISVNSDERRNNVDDVLERNTVAFVAVPEKIVLCVDVSQDPNTTSYQKSDKTNCNPFEVLKKALSPFIVNKNSFNNDHEFAVMTIEPNGVKWIKDFSSNPQEVINTIDNLEPVNQTDCNTDYDLTCIFKELKSKVGCLPDATTNSVQYPTHIVRLFLIYNSSYSLPKLVRSDECYRTLISSNYFVWDVLYLHDAPSSENNCQDIYSKLISFLKVGSFYHETSRKITKLFNMMAKFLAHPLQRPQEELGINEQDSPSP